MNSIERVKAAIHFDKPDKVPIYKIGLGDVFPMSAMPYKEWQPGYNEGEEGLFPHTMDDFVIKSKVWRWKKPAWAKKLEEKDPRYKDNNWLKVKREEIDQWGCIWMRNGTNATMGHPGRPSLPDWSKYEEYMERYTPDPTNESQYKLLIRVSKLVARKKYKLCSIGNGPLENGSHMRGFHNYLIDHRKHPQELKRMIDHFTEFYITTMKMFKKLGANPNGFILVEDLGEQSGPYFNPKLFTKFYEPFYRAICDEAHSMGCDMHQHCCGKV
ncbi:MAG: hypothetical protein GY870_12050, partial [archaeon]|nr:hypothetical protein [archaeon]